MAKQYMLTTMQGTKLIISEKQDQYLQTVNLNKFVQINGQTINTSSIAEIIELEEYYKNNPNKRPAPTYYNKLPEQPKQKSYSEKKHQKRLETMKKGFLRGVAKARGIKEVTPEQLSENQRKTYNNLEEKLQELQTSKT